MYIHKSESTKDVCVLFLFFFLGHPIIAIISRYRSGQDEQWGCNFMAL